MGLGLATITIGWISLSFLPRAVTEAATREQRIEQEVALIARSAERVAGLATINDSITRFEQVVGRLSASVLAGYDERTASIDLMRRITALLDEAGDLEAFGEGSAMGSAGPLRLVSLSVRFLTDFPGLTTFVRSIESDPILAIEAASALNLDADSVDVHLDVERLVIEAEISGWYLTGPALDDTGEP